MWMWVGYILMCVCVNEVGGRVCVGLCGLLCVALRSLRYVVLRAWAGSIRGAVIDQISICACHERFDI